MHNLIRKILGRTEPEPEVIPFDTLPEWLGTKERSAKALLVSRTGGPEQKIRETITNLQDIVTAIAQGEHDPAIHPKLKSIAKNSLPLFVKAMHASLAKELPADTETFYPAAVEILKNCLNSTRGQGRYLQIVFPEEMKAIRTKIDEIGREINEITQALADYRKEQTMTADIRHVYDALVDVEVDLAKAAGKDQRITNRIKEISERIRAIENEVLALPEQENVGELAGLESALRESEAMRDVSARSYAALSMTASHVFRKAEKIASRQKHPAEVAILRHMTELLSDHEVPDSTDLENTLRAACPIAERMILSGEIQLKNKEERAIFSDMNQFAAGICTNCADLVTRNETCRIAREKRASHPLKVRSEALEREKNQLEIMLRKEYQSREELEEWRSKTRDKIPEFRSVLQQNIEKLAGRNVLIKMGTPVSHS